MARKKRHEQHEEHIDETWLVPYADILTLLLALFIVLFAVSQTDQKKVTEMAQAFSAAFHPGGPSIFDKAGQKENQTTTLPMDNANQNYVRENQQLLDTQKEMDDYIEKNGLQEDLSTVLTEEGLLIRIKEKALFPSGSADLIAASQSLGRPIAGLLETVTQRIVISGHTDNMPISNSQFPSNWDLSTARSLNFMKFILVQGKLEPARFSTVGYGEYRPAADNKTEQGRAQNRRVEVLISRAYNSNQMQVIQ